MTTVKLSGHGLNDWFAVEAVKEYGPDGARERTCGPARAAVERVIASLPPERECCGTFHGSPHRSTCAKYRGKFKPANAL